MSMLYPVLGIVVILLGALWYAVRQGRKLERGAAAEADNEVKDAQLEAAANMPKTLKELADDLRKGGVL